MTSNDVVLRVIDAFDRLGISYLLVGSYSSNFYGKPRSTNDADFVVQFAADAIPALANALGGNFDIDPQMSFETITSTLRYVATHRASPFKVEMFLLSDDAHDQLRFRRRVAVPFEGRKVFLPTPEDVVITKLRWSKGGNRAKDVSDVSDVLALQHATLDLAYVRHWCDAHGTRDLFERLLAAAVGS